MTSPAGKTEISLQNNNSTGTITFTAGTGISLSGATKDQITITNTGPTEEHVKELIKAYSMPISGSNNHPVVLWSGNVGFNNSSPGKVSANGYIYPGLTLNVSVYGGVLKMIFYNNDLTNITNFVLTGAAANQYSSNDIAYNLSGSKNNQENEGAAWLQTSIVDNQAWIREFHQGNNHNDGWHSDNWISSQILRATVIVFGYVTRKNEWT